LAPESGTIGFAFVEQASSRDERAPRSRTLFIEGTGITTIERRVFGQAIGMDGCRVGKSTTTLAYVQLQERCHFSIWKDTVREVASRHKVEARQMRPRTAE